MKTWKILVFVLMLAVALCAYSAYNAPKQQDPPTKEEVTAPANLGQETQVEPSQGGVSPALALYQVFPVSVGTQTGQVEIYTSAQKDDKGAMMWDDSNAFFIHMVLGETQYVLLEEQTVQLGTPKVAAFTDSEEILHVILTDARTAQYHVVEFTAASSETVLNKTEILTYDAVNYLGES